MVPALAFWGDYLRDLPNALLNFHQLPQWTENIAFGSDILQVLHYYVIGDPFSLIAVFFSKESAGICLTVLIFIKLYFMGLGMYFYSKRHFSTLPALTAAFAYCFSVFAMKLHWESLFINAAIFLPLILWAIDFAFEKPGFKRTVPLTVFVFFNMTSTDLLSEQVLLFSFVYAVVMYRKQIIKLILPVTFGLALSAFVWFPSFVNLLNAPRANQHGFVPTFYTLTFYTRVLTPWFNIFGGDVEDMFTVSPIVLTALIFLFSFPARKGANRLKLGVILVFFALFSPHFAFLMSGLQAPKNRWTYLFVFLCALAVGYFSENFKEFKKEAENATSRFNSFVFLSVVVAAVSILISIPLLTFREEYRVNVFVYLIFALFIMALVVVVKKQSFLTKYFEIKFVELVQFSLLGFLFISTVICGNLYIYSTQRDGDGKLNFFSQSEINTKLIFQSNANYAASLKEDEADYFRMTDAFTGDSPNSGLMNSVSTGNSSYLNGISKETIAFRNSNSAFSHMGMSWNNYDKYSLLDVNSSTGVKYLITKKEINKELLGYSDFKNVDAKNIKINKTALPFAYTLPLNTSQKELTIKGEIIKEIPLPRVFESKAEQSNLEIDLQANDKEKLQNPEIHAFLIFNNMHFVPEKFNSEDFDFASLYDYAPYSDKYMSGVLNVYSGDKRIDGITIMNDRYEYSLNSTNYIFELDKNDLDDLRLNFAKLGKYSFNFASLQIVDYSSLEQQFKERTAQKVGRFEHRYNEYSGNVDFSEDQILATQLPFVENNFLGVSQNGWSVFVDGKKVETQIVNKAFLGVRVGAGSHTIKIVYTTPFLKAAFLVSIFAFIALLATILFTVRSANRRKVSA